MEADAHSQTTSPNSVKRLIGLMTLPMVLALAGCSNLKKKEQSVAQCQLDANTPKALAFRKDSAGSNFDPHAKNWDYKEFMLTCMQAKGHPFQKVLDDGGKINEMCFSRNADQRGHHAPYVEEPSCYF